ncbi:MAG: DNA cytosine methyltransferase [bacterium]
MKINFIDLFSGIGGFRLGFEQAAASLSVKAKCVFSSEIDKFARQTYKANFGEEPAGDFSLIDYSTIPKHSVCLASTSCQPFSQAGKGLKGNDTRNTIPYLLNYIAVCMPPVLIHENVVELRNSQEYRQMLYALDKLGYTVFDRVYNSISVTPQNRSRLFTVAFKNFNFAFAFEWPELPELNLKMRDILEEDVPDKYTLKDKTWLCSQRKVGEYYRKWKPELLDAVRESCGLTAETGGGVCLFPQIKERRF